MNSVYLITNISKDKKENKNTVEIELIIIVNALMVTNGTLL